MNLMPEYQMDGNCYPYNEWILTIYHWLHIYKEDQFIFFFGWRKGWIFYCYVFQRFGILKSGSENSDNINLYYLNYLMLIDFAYKTHTRNFKIIPITSMGVLASGSAHTRPSTQPPIDVSGNFPAHVSAESLFWNFPIFRSK